MHHSGMSWCGQRINPGVHRHRTGRVRQVAEQTDPNEKVQQWIDADRGAAWSTLHDLPPRC